MFGHVGDYCTVTETLIEWLEVPLVPVRTTVYGPAGVPGSVWEPPPPAAPPPQPTVPMNPRSSRKKIDEPSRRRLKAGMPNQMHPASTVPAMVDPNLGA